MSQALAALAFLVPVEALYLVLFFALPRRRRYHSFYPLRAAADAWWFAMPFLWYAASRITDLTAGNLRVRFLPGLLASLAPLLLWTAVELALALRARRGGEPTWMEWRGFPARPDFA